MIHDVKHLLRQPPEPKYNLAERRARNAVRAARQKTKRLAKKYDIEWEDDSYREKLIVLFDGRYYGYYNHLHYFPKPDFIEGADPLGDGHYAYNWDETLWLVEFYARHNPEHPDYEHRDHLEIAPHC